jgi:hypothetical protein
MQAGVVACTYQGLVSAATAMTTALYSSGEIMEVICTLCLFVSV